jgi:hypothetical protein
MTNTLYYNIGKGEDGTPYVRFYRTYQDAEAAERQDEDLGFGWPEPTANFADLEFDDHGFLEESCIEEKEF